jgi:hypothetical protein
MRLGAQKDIQYQIALRGPTQARLLNMIAKDLFFLCKFLSL